MSSAPSIPISLLKVLQSSPNGPLASRLSSQQRVILPTNVRRCLLTAPQALLLGRTNRLPQGLTHCSPHPAPTLTYLLDIPGIQTCHFTPPHVCTDCSAASACKALNLPLLIYLGNYYWPPRSNLTDSVNPLKTTELYMLSR